MNTHYIFKLTWIFWLSLIFVFVENDLFGFSTISNDDSPLKTDIVLNPVKQTRSCLPEVKTQVFIKSIEDEKGFDKSRGENGSENDGYLQINFTFPETVEAGQIFNFEFVIAKMAEHSIGGKFQFTWPEGFAPMVSDNPNAKCKVDKNKILVEWSAQSFPDDIKIAYPVQVKNATSGVYPILSVLTFTGGLQVQKNAKIRVDVNKSGILPNHTINATIGSCSVILKYEREVEFGSKFDLGIKIDKGNVTGKAYLTVSVPPNSDVKVLNHEGVEYNKQSGKLKLIWKKLPDNSTINVNCEVICNTSVKAVYPISAEFFIDEKIKAFFSNSIYVTDKLIVISQRSAEQTKREQAGQKADSLKLYAEMDELLNQWKNATKVITVETGKENLLPENQKVEVNQRATIEPIRKPDPNTQAALKTGQEVVSKAEPGLPKKTEPEVTKKTEQEAAKQTGTEVTKKSEPEVTKKAELEASKKTEPQVAKKTEPEVAKKTEPEVAKNTEPEAAKKVEPQVAKKTEPEVAKKTEPQVVKKAEPELTKKTEPVTNKAEEPKKETINTEKKPTENAQTPATLPVAKNVENTQKQQAQTDKSAPADAQVEGLKMYRVQIAASKTPLPGTKQFIQSLGFFEIITEDYDGTWYRYFIGEFSQIADAKDFNKTLVEKGISDSFVVTFVDGKRVTSN